jgi:hypothetical protein
MNAASSLRMISLPMHYFVARPGTHKKNFLLFVGSIFSILFFSLKFQLRGCDCQEKKTKQKQKQEGREIGLECWHGSWKFSSVIVLLEHFLFIIIIKISTPCFHYSIEFSMILSLFLSPFMNEEKRIKVYMQPRVFQILVHLST